MSLKMWNKNNDEESFLCMLINKYFFFVRFPRKTARFDVENQSHFSVSLLLSLVSSVYKLSIKVELKQFSTMMRKK